MMLTTVSTISFTSPLAQTLRGKIPVAMSEVLDSVGLADASGQKLTHIRGNHLTTVLENLPQQIGDVSVSGSAILARLRTDAVLAIGEISLQNTIADNVLTVTDITHGRGHLLLIGHYAREVLAKTCSLNFADSAFPDHHAAQTSLAKAQTTIIRHDRGGVPAYYLITGYSLAEYVWGVVFDTMGEFDGKFIKKD